MKRATRTVWLRFKSALAHFSFSASDDALSSLAPSEKRPRI
ncbi:hypothetical protein [Halanaeroarchaeum sp. HSR-CO]|nr:hypothetical protein [Halanaeroarchaeum sp. HSR-CO]